MVETKYAGLLKSSRKDKTLAYSDNICDPNLNQMQDTLNQLLKQGLQDLQGQINEIVPIENSDIDNVIDGSYVPITPVPSQSIEKRLDAIDNEIEGIKKSNMKPKEIEEMLT